MADFRTRIEVSADAESTFEYLADFVNVAEWDPNVRSAKALGDGPPGVGSAYVVTTGFYGKAIELVCEIVGFEAPNRLEIGVDGGRARGRYRITVTGGEDLTTIDYEVSMELKGMGRVLDRGLQLALNGIAENAVSGLKRRLNTTQNA
jgi:carbon monoxide dehydrogenase subunit G